MTTITTNMTREDHIKATARILALGFTIKNPKEAARIKKTSKVGIIKQFKNMLRGCTEAEMMDQFNAVVHDLLELGTPVPMIEQFLNANDDTY